MPITVNGADSAPRLRHRGLEHGPVRVDAAQHDDDAAASEAGTDAPILAMGVPTIDVGAETTSGATSHLSG